MDKYELVVIVDAALSQQEKEDTIKNVSQAIEKCDGKVINSQVWIENQKMSFLMKKKSNGTYYVINFEGGEKKHSELRRAIKLNDKVLRSLIVKASK